MWARMPGRPEDPMGVESNVELMGFVLSENWLGAQKVGFILGQRPLHTEGLYRSGNAGRLSHMACGLRTQTKRS